VENLKLALGGGTLKQEGKPFFLDVFLTMWSPGRGRDSVTGVLHQGGQPTEVPWDLDRKEKLPKLDRKVGKVGGTGGGHF